MKTNQQFLQHLYLRAGFGEPHSIIHQNINKPLTQVVETILQDAQTFPSLSVKYIPTFRRGKGKGNGKMIRQQNKSFIKEINLTWFWEMAHSKAFLREKMALFWRDHFASKNRHPALVQQQINTLRQLSLGNFGDLLLALSKDTVMLAFLNNQQNRKVQPNENFARELLELFTLGIGHYSETDVKEAARAFTGWAFDEEGKFRFNKRQHDFGQKTFLGKTGNWNGEDIIHILLEQKQTAYYLCSKFYQYFVNPQADESKIQELADYFYQSNYDISGLLYKIFTADWFYEKQHIGVKIKSPIEYLVGLCRTLHLRFEDDEILIFLQKALGQVLLAPPNVAGWTSNQGWIDSSTLLFRLRMGAFLFSAKDIDFETKDRGDINAIFRSVKKFEKAKVRPNWEQLQQDFKGIKSADLAETLANYLLQNSISLSLIQPQIETQNRKETIKKIIENLLSLPEYQLC